MDPVSAIGLIAASTQLAEQVFNAIKLFSEICGTLKEAPELTKARLLHLEQLSSVSKLIAATKSLQTDEVQNIIAACLETALDLSNTLKKCSAEEKGRLRRALSSVNTVLREDRVLVLLDRLEKEKSLLVLCIHQIDASQLHSVNVKVSEVHAKLSTSLIKFDDTAANVQTLINITPNLASQVQTLHQDVPGLLARIHNDVIAGLTATHKANIQSKYFRLFLLALIILIPAIVLTASQPVLQRKNLDTPVKSFLYEVPNRPVDDFVGREDVLARIEGTFSSPVTRTPKTIVIRAMGGQGKTQVALEFCRRSRALTDVFWVDATSEESLRGGFSALSYVLDSTLDNSDWEARSSFTRRTLANSGRPWLLVFDNYDNPQSYDIRKYIPENMLGRIIITSRHKDSESLTDKPQRIQLCGLEEKEAVRLLLSRAIGQAEADNSTSEQATVIVERLGYLPLAIAQAGAYINMRRLPLHKFLQEYDKKQELIMKDTTPLMSEYRKKLSSEKEIQMSVFTTSELSYQILLSLEKGQKRNIPKVLTLLAFFGSNHISLGLFSAYCLQEHDMLSPSASKPGFPTLSRPSLVDGLPVPPIGAPGNVSDGNSTFLCTHGGQWDPDSFLEVLIILSQLSLVELSPHPRGDGYRYVSLHPLLKDWIKWRTPQEDFPEYLSLAVTCVFRLLSSTPYGESSLQFDVSSALGQELNAYFYDHTSSIPEPSQGPIEVYPAPVSVSVSGLMFNIGCIFDEYKDDWTTINLDNISKSEKIFNISGNGISIYFVQRTRVWFGRSFSQQLAQHELENYYDRSMIRPIPSNYGFPQRQFSNSERILKGVLDMVELDTDSLNTWVPETDLAGCRTEKEGFIEAGELYHRAYSLSKNSLGHYHRFTLMLMTQLGWALVDLRSSDDAENIFRDAMNKATMAFGEANITTLGIANDLARLLYFTHRYKATRDLLTRIVRLRKAHYGEKNEDTIRDKRSLAHVIWKIEGLPTITKVMLSFVNETVGSGNSQGDRSEATLQ